MVEYTEIDLRKFCDAENANFNFGLRQFKDELSFFVRLEAMYSVPGKRVPDSHVAIIELFQLCHHNLIFSFLNLLRCHFKEPCVINRNSIEAIGQAAILNENPITNTKIWCMGEGGDEQEIESFKRIFKNDKFRKCVHKKELKGYFEMFSSMSHPNITIGIHRTRREGEQMLSGFFDVEEDNLEAWMIRYLNYTVLAYVIILKEFSIIFREVGFISDKQLDELAKDHREYMETRRALLSQDGRYAD